MKKYIDCDGVILDTENGLFDEYGLLLIDNPNLSMSEYLQNLDWESWIEQARVLNDAINILKNYDPRDTEILTRVSSLNEAIVKIKYFRSKGVKNNIIIVPEDIDKSQVVFPFENILVDDNPYNLRDWEKNFGIPYYFGNEPSRFEKVNSLDEILNPKKLSKKLEARNDKKVNI